MTIIGAPPSIIGPIDAALSGANDAVEDAVAELEADLASQPGVAGMVAGVSDPDVFSAYLAELGQDINLLAMQNYVLRMQANLTAGAV